MTAMLNTANYDAKGMLLAFNMPHITMQELCFCNKKNHQNDFHHHPKCFIT